MLSNIQQKVAKICFVAGHGEVYLSVCLYVLMTKLRILIFIYLARKI